MSQVKLNKHGLGFRATAAPSSSRRPTKKTEKTVDLIGSPTSDFVSVLRSVSVLYVAESSRVDFFCGSVWCPNFATFRKQYSVGVPVYAVLVARGFKVRVDRLPVGRRCLTELRRKFGNCFRRRSVLRGAPKVLQPHSRVRFVSAGKETFAPEPSNYSGQQTRTKAIGVRGDVSRDPRVAGTRLEDTVSAVLRSGPVRYGGEYRVADPDYASFVTSTPWGRSATASWLPGGEVMYPTRASLAGVQQPSGLSDFDLAAICSDADDADGYVRVIEAPGIASGSIFFYGNGGDDDDALGELSRRCPG
ncbi:hypothetical protein [Colletotrichum fructicola chrysovirus 1]|uniref:Uncharacterized protein n=1 Tax=Colletotrichum fructicola chrysovirus 1 TaxID=2304034 RepID=A0A346IME4_9VIRU|nr:hypothetical protein [Colletotrichum fructicola chrysovirus 1]AXP19679.1 hypothetical protein [Colletotrichum fructicola chrysovirus 1]